MKPDNRQRTSSSKARLVERQCAGLHRKPDLIAAFQRDAAAAGLVGEADTAAIVFLADYSALLPKPVALKLGGSSSAGKSYVAGTAHAFLPPSAVLTLTSMSRLALAYYDEPIAHRTVFLIESQPLSDDAAAYLIRALLSEGLIRHATVQPGKGGRMESMQIEQHGPCAFVTTLTLPALDYDLETRLLGVSVDESREQTRRILRDQADRANTGTRAPVDYRPWHALYHYARLGPRAVEVPFAPALVDAIPDDAMAIRMRRAGTLVLSFISASALLHRATREIAADGRIIASRADYEHVHKLLASPLAEGLQHAVPAGVREVVEAVKGFQGRADDDDDDDNLGPSSSKRPNQADLVKLLDSDSGTVSRHVRIALHHGWLRDELPDNTRNSRLTLGDPLPDEGQVLPEPEAVFAGFNPTMVQRPARPASTEGRRVTRPARPARPARPTSSSRASTAKARSNIVSIDARRRRSP